MGIKAKRLVKGSFLRGVDFFSQAAVSLFLTPFIIHSLGDQMYGLWVFVGAFIGYYGLMDLGLETAIQRYISKSIGSNEPGEVNKIINTALSIFSIIGLVALLISFAIAYIAPFLIKNITDKVLFSKLVLILGINFSIGLPLRVFSAVLSSNIRYDLNTAIELLKLILRTALIIFFINSGHGIVALALITSLFDLSGYFARYFIVKKLFKYIVISREFFSKQVAKLLFSYSVYVLVSKIANQLRYNISSLVIVFFLGLNMVTMYSIGSRLVIYSIELVTAIVGIFIPVFSQYEASNDLDLLQEKFLLTTKVSSYFSILVGGIVIILGLPFIRRWVGSDYAAAYPVLVILMIGIIFNLMQSPSSQLLYGISKHKFLTFINLIEGFLNLVLSMILVKQMGIQGVAWGTFIPMVVISLIVLPVYTCWSINLSLRKYYFKLLIPAILKSVFFLSVLWLMLNRILLPSYSWLSLSSFVIIASFSIFVFYFGFSEEERIYFRKVANSFMNGSKQLE